MNKTVRWIQQVMTADRPWDSELNRWDEYRGNASRVKSEWTGEMNT